MSEIHENGNESVMVSVFALENGSQAVTIGDKTYVLVDGSTSFAWRPGRKTENNALPEGVTPERYARSLTQLDLTSVLELAQRAYSHGLNNQADSAMINLRESALKDGKDFVRATELDKWRVAWIKKVENGELGTRKPREVMPAFSPRETEARDVVFGQLVSWASSQGVTFPAKMTPAALKTMVTGPGGEMSVNDLMVMLLDETKSPRAKAIWAEADRRIAEKQVLDPFAGMVFAPASEDDSDDLENGENVDSDDTDEDNDIAELPPEPEPAPTNHRRGRQLPAK